VSALLFVVLCVYVWFGAQKLPKED
jgi:hypothetical protein